MGIFLKAKLFISAFLLSMSIAHAQERSVKIEAKVNTNRSVDFNFVKTDPGTYTVVVDFIQLINAGRPVAYFPAANYSGRLFTLTPTNKDQGIAYRYKFFYIRGKLKPKYDANFIYLLPYKANVKVQVAESKFLGAIYFGNTTPEDWKAYRFYTTEQDTVTAMRKGVVVDIKDLYESVDENNISYTSKTNELTIEHQDGTMATYKGFKKGSFAVKLGQTVFPGSALGLNSKYDQNGDYNVSVMLMYLKSYDIGNRSGFNSLYGFITPHFITSDSPDEVLVARKVYTSITTPEVIQKEMSKKERKLLSVPKK